MGGEFVAHGFDLGFHGDVFLFFAGEVVARELQFGADAFRGEQVGVFQFVLGAHEVASLDMAFVEQRFDQVVGLAQADTKPFGKLPLADFRFRFDDLEDAELGLFAMGHDVRSGFERDVNGGRGWVARVCSLRLEVWLLDCRAIARNDGVFAALGGLGRCHCERCAAIQMGCV